jgi:glucan phosphoethanolaminetransferase (alkaline phosphatase superfamily)
MTPLSPLSPRRAALWFTAGLLLFEALCLHVGYRDLRALRLSSGNLRLLEAISASLASTGLVFLFVLASFTTSRLLRIAYFAVFCLTSAVEYGYQYAFGRFSEVPDYEVALVAINRHILTGAVSTYLNPLFVIPCVVYGLLLLTVDEPSGKRRRSLRGDTLVAVGVITAFALLLTLAASWGVYRYPLLSTAASFRTLASVSRLMSIDPGPREAVSYAASAQPHNNVIFIIDESLRGDHLSLNGYARETTPFLDALAKSGAMANWGIAAAAATCSIATNRLLLTGTDLAHVWTAPTIFQYAKAMGYRTFYMDGQMTTPWNGTSRDRYTWDEWFTANNFNSDGAATIDVRVAIKTADIVRHSVGNFVWINKFGVHTAYDVDYPASEAVWKPVYGGPGVALSRMMAPPDPARRYALINSYDNAIRWNLETFFRTLLADGIPAETTFVYTSDHGQTLSEQGETHSHCGTSKTEATVPLFIIGSVGSFSGVDTEYRASHSNIFATLLDLMGFPETSRRLRYDVSLLKARAGQSRPRTFLGDGQVHQFDSDRQASGSH